MKYIRITSPDCPSLLRLFLPTLFPYRRETYLDKGLKISFRQKEREQTLKSLAVNSYFLGNTGVMG